MLGDLEFVMILWPKLPVFILQLKATRICFWTLLILRVPLTPFLGGRVSCSSVCSFCLHFPSAGKTGTHCHTRCKASTLPTKSKRLLRFPEWQHSHPQNILRFPRALTDTINSKGKFRDFFKFSCVKTIWSGRAALK